MTRLVRYLLVPFFFTALCAHAEPYLAVQMGLKCGTCHVNPTGGGERTAFGNAFAQTQLAATRLDTGSDLWTGQVMKFLSIGGDVRFDGTYTQVPHSSSTDDFELQQGRVYLSANVIPDRFYVYVDELVAPGGALNREAYGVFWSANHNWYIKAGQMYLPFGFRLQDLTAFVQQVSNINMATPDQGVEFGFEHDNWDAQFAVTNGTSGGPEVDHGKQYSLQLQYVTSRWRFGVAGNFNNAAAGNRSIGGLFAGLRTGPVSWLAEADVVDDKSTPLLSGRQLGSLLEADWRIAQGHNLKLDYEYLDPNRSVTNDGETRYSLVYEMTPIQYLQIRLGLRWYDGIPQDPSQHEKLGFLELHGFF